MTSRDRGGNGDGATGRKLLWFIALWAAGVLAVALVAGLVRLSLGL